VISECLELGRPVTFLRASDWTYSYRVSKKIVVGELTVCHETNLQQSRDYKLQKYSNLEAARAGEFKSHSVLVHTIEVSTLGFVVAEPNFLKNGEISSFDIPLLKQLSKSAILSSRSIYCNRDK